MMRLHFEPSGSVKGAFIKTYLLEKSRVVSITDPERCYHIFYDLVAGAPTSCKGTVLSGLKSEQVRVLAQSRCMTLAGVDDAKAYAEVTGALDNLGVSADSQSELFTVLSALLLLGNTTMIQDDNDKLTLTRT